LGLLPFLSRSQRNFISFEPAAIPAVIDYQPVLPAKQTIALGNSLVQSGFNPDEFVAAQQLPSVRSAALNMAMGASSPAEHLLLRAALRADDRAPLVLYGFYDFQLTDPVSFAFSDVIGNHDLPYYGEPEFAPRYDSMSRYDAAGFEIARHFLDSAEFVRQLGTSIAGNL
jgi:hypothetical protein